MHCFIVLCNNMLLNWNFGWCISKHNKICYKIKWNIQKFETFSIWNKMLHSFATVCLLLKCNNLFIFRIILTIATLCNEYATICCIFIMSVILSKRQQIVSVLIQTICGRKRNNMFQIWNNMLHIYWVVPFSEKGNNMFHIHNKGFVLVNERYVKIWSNMLHIYSVVPFTQKCNNMLHIYYVLLFAEKCNKMSHIYNKW